MSNKTVVSGTNAVFEEYSHGKLTARTTGIFPASYVFVRGGSNNPSFRSGILRGENVSNNLTVQLSKVTFDRAFTSSMLVNPWPFGSNPASFANKGDVFPNFAIQVYQEPFQSEWELLALRKASRVFLKRLREADRKFQGGVFFGEIVPTFRMLVRPFGSLRDGILDYVRAVHKRGRGLSIKKDRHRLNKILGDSWLEFSFGWTPLLEDIKDASGALIDIYANLRKTRVKAEEGVETDERKFSSSLVLNSFIYEIWRVIKKSYSVRYYGALEPLPSAEFGIPYLERLRLQSNFDWSAFVPTVWELIPYSFLIDYFSNVGEILEMYSTDTSKLQRLSMVEWRVASEQRSFEHSPVAQYLWATGWLPGKEVTPPPVAQFQLSGQGGATTIRQVGIIRWPFATLEYPGLRLELPIKAKQFANMAALLAGSRKYRG